MTNKVFSLEFNPTNKIISIPEIYGFYLQGFTTVDDKIFAVIIADDESKCIFKVFDINDNKEIFSKTEKSVGHANDVTFNNKDNRIYIVHGGGTDIVHVYDTNYNYIEDVHFTLPIRSLTYVDDKDIYLARTVSNGYSYNSDYSLKNNFPFIIGMNFSTDIARQGWEYYNNYLFYANWSWIRLGGDGTNYIRIYDLYGNRLDVLNTNDSYGELEDIAFYDNKMVLGFNSYNNTIDFYLEDIPEFNTVVEIEEEEVKEEISNDKNYNYVYFIIGFVIFFILGYIIKKRF